MKRSILFCLVLLGHCCFAQDWKQFKYESGDLLFQENDCGEICNALKAVTPAYERKSFNHVGLVYKIKDSVWVIEAYGQDVHVLPLYKFMERSVTPGGQPKVTVGRVSAEYQTLTGRAVGFALEKRGAPYDHDYRYDNGKYFSSELVFDAYKAAHNGKALFEAEPMSFRDHVTSKLNPIWEAYFKEIGVKPPEGKSCVSPGALAGDINVEMVVSFY